MLFSWGAVYTIVISSLVDLAINEQIVIPRYWPCFGLVFG